MKNKLFPHSTKLLFVLIILFIIISRLYTYNEPLDHDLTTYAVISHELNNGGKLYKDVWDIKPPGIFISYAFFEKLFGYNNLYIFMMGLFCALLVIPALFKSAKYFDASGKASVLAIILWMFMSGEQLLEANQPNTESFINLYLAWVILLFLGLKFYTLELKKLILIGILLFMATLYKTYVILIPFGLAIYVTAFAPKDKKLKAFQKMLIVIAVGASLWSFVLLYFYFTKRWEIFTNTLFTFASKYSGNLFQNLIESFSFSAIFPKWQNPAVFILQIIAFLGLPFIYKKDKCKCIFLIFLYLFAQLAVGIRAKYYPHYYQLIVLPLILMGATSISLFLNQKNKTIKSLSYVTSIAIIVLFIVRTNLYFSMSPVEWAQKKYGKIMIRPNKAIKELKKLIYADEKIYVWGRETEFYFYTKARPATPLTLLWPLENPITEEYFTKQVLTYLEKNKPRIIVVYYNDFARMRDNLIVRWMSLNYKAVSIPLENTRPYIFLEKKKEI